LITSCSGLMAGLRLVATYHLRTRLPQCGAFLALENATQCVFSRLKNSY